MSIRVTLLLRGLDNFVSGELWSASAELATDDAGAARFGRDPDPESDEFENVGFAGAAVFGGRLAGGRFA